MDLRGEWPVRAAIGGSICVVVAMLDRLLPMLSAAQLPPLTLDKEFQDKDNDQEVAEKFDFDWKTAARLRPQLMALSIAPGSRYATGSQVLAKLVEQVDSPQRAKYFWELRIVNDGFLNAYSSPDATIYVESGLADLAGKSAGLWAAVLSHEIAHVVRRDWARRYLYEQSLRDRGGATIALGDPGLPSAEWMDSTKASADLARFCRKIEVDADLESLMLMARAGYHPDFVPALHHLLHAQSADKTEPSIFALHPCWEERDRELDHAYVAASIEFEHRWPETYASPGGNPPILVFADRPIVRKKSTGEWEIRVPIRCQNLAGAVEVVLQTYAIAASSSSSSSSPQTMASGAAVTGDDEVRELTGCTSPKTTVSFTIADASRKKLGAEVFVLGVEGAVLSRATIPKLRP